MQLHGQLDDSTEVECAEGYRGVAVVEACASPGGVYRPSLNDFCTDST